MLFFSASLVRLRCCVLWALRKREAPANQPAAAGVRDPRAETDRQQKARQGKGGEEKDGGAKGGKEEQHSSAFERAPSGRRRAHCLPERGSAHCGCPFQRQQDSRESTQAACCHRQTEASMDACVIPRFPVLLSTSLTDPSCCVCLFVSASSSLRFLSLSHAAKLSCSSQIGDRDTQ
jgi:hypothetical protein